MDKLNFPKLLLFISFLSMIISSIIAHKCYECDSLEGDPCDPGREVLCPANENACRTIINLANHVLEKGCTESDENEPEDCHALEGSYACICYENNCNKNAPKHNNLEL